MSSPQLSWLTEISDARDRMATLARGEGEFAGAVELAGSKLDFIRVNALDGVIRRRWPERPAEFARPTLKLAVLGSSTTGHLLPALRVAGLRHGLWLDVFEADYGQFRQALDDERLRQFLPDVILFALDAAVFLPLANDPKGLGHARALFESLWRAARALGAAVLQPTLLPTAAPLFGQNEHRLPFSPAAFLARLNASLREWADAENVDLIAIDAEAARDGLAFWRDELMWARAKQDVRAAAAPMYGELVARVLAARSGRSRKCLVLDLDNTLWGGVIGDDGLGGLTLGQGSALGEGFLAVQAYARELKRRGIVLAVCSKNDEANAREPFERHPDMILRLDDIACFVANWDDKPTNIRRIAARLNLGLDALVFLDDNPFERNFVREALPMVAVPEIPDEPALIPQALAAAGYFEAVALTSEDLARAEQYAGNLARKQERESHADLGAYLASLDMRAIWGRFDTFNKARIVQLINKTNQFNLTTRRYDEQDYDAFLRDASILGLHLRLTDRFGDNGLIAVVIARLDGATAFVDTWLMSCRVLGRGVEAATLALLAAEAKRRGATRLVGEYLPSPKNEMVREHYDRLGFQLISEAASDSRRYELLLNSSAPSPPYIALVGPADG